MNCPPILYIDNNGVARPYFDKKEIIIVGIFFYFLPKLNRLYFFVFNEDLPCIYYKSYKQLQITHQKLFRNKGENEMKKWIKCPFPGEKWGEGKWFEVKTKWEQRLYEYTKLPKMESENDPN